MRQSALQMDSPTSRLEKAHAIADDCCERCGYAFDAGDRVVTDTQTGFVYCGARCAAGDTRQGRLL